MALERESIEKKDFPVGRRGYDPAAVDAHLSALADEVEQLKRSSRQRGDTLASTAADQVRGIVDAAEQSAAAIRTQAEEEASSIRAEAKREARRERAQAAADAKSEREGAAAEARDYVGRVSETTAQMVQRFEAMDTELATLTESLQTGASRLKGELDLLESELKDVGAASLASSATEPDDLEPEYEDDEELDEDVEVEAPAEDEPQMAAEPEELPEPEPEPIRHEETAEPEMADAAGPGGDTEGARLIALNMALNGTPREETDRYLAENFELSDRDRLLDEVYASVE